MPPLESKGLTVKEEQVPLARSDLIPPTTEVRESLAWLQWIVFEALGYCWVMPDNQRRVACDIIAAHLYTNGVHLSDAMKRHLAPSLGTPKEFSIQCG
jgi:hypothetical protein